MFYFNFYQSSILLCAEKVNELQSRFSQTIDISKYFLSLEWFRRAAHWGGSHMAHQGGRQEQWWEPRFPWVTKSFNWQIIVGNILYKLLMYLQSHMSRQQNQSNNNLNALQWMYNKYLKYFIFSYLTLARSVNDIFVRQFSCYFLLDWLFHQIKTILT